MGQVGGDEGSSQGSEGIAWHLQRKLLQSIKRGVEGAQHHHLDQQEAIVEDDMTKQGSKQTLGKINQ